MSLMSICHPFSIWLEFLTPNIWFSCQSSARREFPFRFGRKTLVSPTRIRLGVRVSHLDDWIAFLAFDGALRASGMSPIRTLYVTPPLEFVIQRDRVIRWRK